MRKPLLVAALTGILLAATAATVFAATTGSAPSTTRLAPVLSRAAMPAQVNAEFAALAATLPACGSKVTNCRYGTAATHLEASVQSPTATIYFEMRTGVVTVLQVYPTAH